jgi:dipeptide transport system ATP-binding protein
MNPRTSSTASSTDAQSADANTVVMAARALTRHYSVSLGFGKGSAMVKALNGVGFELRHGHTLAVVGESGCGKSTLARQLTLVEKPTSGDLFIQNTNMAQATPADLKRLRPKVQMVFQNPYASLNPRKQVQAMLEEPLKLNGVASAAERRERVAAAIARVGLRPEHVQRYPHMFSGGQRQRIAIARAMMLTPDILVADEPTSALDVSIQAQILNLFMDLQDELGTAYVFISHNLSVVEHVARDVMVMYFGSAVEQGPKTEIFARPLHPYTRALMSATPAIRAHDRREKIKLVGELPSPLNPPTGCTFHTRCPYAAEICRAQVPVAQHIEGRDVACHRVGEFV